MARTPLSRALILVVALLLASLRQVLLLALGNVAGPRRVQRQERALDQFVLQRVDELFRLQQRQRARERVRLSGLREDVMKGDLFRL